MADRSHKKLKEIFNAALEKEPGEREGLLSEECGDDVELRQEIEALLSVYENSESFMEEPLVGDLSEKNYLKEGQKIGHYEIIERIGKGGMGEVYLARDKQLNRRVALKILSPALTGDPERLKRFEQEAFAVSALNHPYILTIHEFGQEAGGTHFIVTEYVKGETLNRYLAGHTPDLSEILDIAIQVSSALTAAHEAGVIHRDIKPENIIVRPDGFIKVLDFGLAKLTDERKLTEADTKSPTLPLIRTDTGVVMGTAPYMSPEQVRGLETDARTDIWSFGVVLYKMLTGNLPFRGENSGDVIAAILKTEPENLTILPHEVKGIVRKCLRKRKTKRYQKTGDLVTVLKASKESIGIKQKKEHSSSPNREEPETKILKVTTADGNTRLKTADTEVRKKSIKNYYPYALIILLISAIGYWYYTSNMSETKQIRSIAIMPFVNVSGDVNVEYLSDGMTETLISKLSRIPNLSVKARSSVFRYKGKKIEARKIGETLEVEAILLGRLLQRGEDLILNLELVESSTENVLWSENYNRKMDDLIILQGEIAKNVFTELKVITTGEKEKEFIKNPTSNIKAYQAYLKGRANWNKRTNEGLEKAIEFFREAIEYDPTFALAWSGLADTYPMYPTDRPTPPEDMEKARLAAKRAMELDPNLVEAYTSLANINGNHNYNFAESERLFKEAIRINPNYPTAHQWYSVILTKWGRHDEAISEMRVALKLDPLSRIINLNMIWTFRYAGKFDEAIDQAKKAINIDPDFSKYYDQLARTYALKKMYAEAFKSYLKAYELGGRRAEFLTGLRKSYQEGGWKEFEKFRLEDMLKNNANPYKIARQYGKQRDKENALLYLKKEL